MLVLTRRKDESILIRHQDVEIEVMVIEVRGKNVRLGVTAPRDIKVLRAEVDRKPEVKP